jgi:hypothetical protein
MGTRVPARRKSYDFRYRVDVPPVTLVLIMRVAILSVAVATSLLTGCASENWLRLKKEAFPTVSAKNPAIRILAVWQVGEGQGPDGLTTRGFAGQIFFLDANDQIPAKVDGDVRVYVFDDQGTAEDGDKPLHQFDYPRESWKVRMTTTKMGPAYVVFVPYTRKGSHKALCSLRMRYTPADGGPPLFSDMAQVSLPGRDGSPEERFALEKSRERTAEQLGNNSSRDLPHRDRSQSARTARSDDERDERDESNEGSAEHRVQRVVAEREAASPRRHAPLTPRERERLMAEALARAEAEAEGQLVRNEQPRPSSVRQATWEEESADDEQVDEQPVERPARVRERGLHPLRRTAEPEEDEPVAEPRSTARRAVHPLLRERAEVGTGDTDDEPDSTETVEYQRRSVNRLSRSSRPREEERHHAEPRTADEMNLDDLEQAALEELAQMSRAERDPARRAMRTWSVDMPK